MPTGPFSHPGLANEAPTSRRWCQVRLRTLLIPFVVLLAAGLLGPTSASAADCPSDNPVIQENECTPQGVSDGWRIVNFDADIAGFATKSSVNVGDQVQLKIGRSGATAPSSVSVDVYRLGYYGNMGGRKIAAASRTNVSINNLFSGCSATDTNINLANYDVQFRMSCFCVPDATAPVVLQVRGGAIVSVTRVSDGAAVPPSRWEGIYYTVDQMFALIADARARGADEVRVSYDPLLRYPTSVFIDQSQRLADEERWFELSSLTPVR